MRENMGLYHGKRVDNGKWVEGYFFETNTPVYRAFIIVDMAVDITDSCADILDFNIVEVIPETVGQFTGLTDKNGTKIFEGDIIKDDWGKLYQVYFTTKSCAFMVKCYSAHSEYETGDYRIGESWCDTIRVVGNIHGNGNLLKGGEPNA